MVSPDVVLKIGNRKPHTGARVIAPGAEEDATARELLVNKYAARNEDDLSDLGRTKLPVASGWPD